MVFCIRGTGETREINFRDSNGADLAARIAQNIRLWENDDIFYDDEQDVYVASRWSVGFWQKYFEIFAENDQELRALKSKYADYEVDSLYFEKPGGGYYNPYDPYEMKDILPSIRETLEKRYNLETAQLVGERRSALPQDDARYFKETLYQQNTGKFFIVGEGGALSAYGAKVSDGSTGCGTRSFPLLASEAQAWVKGQAGWEIMMNPF